MDRDARLPIKIVVPRAEDLRRPEFGGGGAKVFDEVTPEIRDALDHQVGEVLRHFEPAFRQAPGIPAVAKVVLKSRALAKSHRPTELFDRAACPIIGGGELGVLHVRALPSGLRNLSHQIQKLSTLVGIANISTIQEITPYRADDALGARGLESLAQAVKPGRVSLKLRLFEHHDAGLDDALHNALYQQAQVLQLPPPQPVHYAPGVRIFRLAGVRPEAIETLTNFVGTQSLSTFPRYRVHRAASQPIGTLLANDFPPPLPGRAYPTVGVVDTGIDPQNTHLAPWVVGRREYVTAGDRDHDHGTFVGGLVVHAQRLNRHPKFPDVSAKILDVLAMPASGALTEDELLTILEEVIPQNPDVKVWNLSVSRDEPCADQNFSEFAAALDRLQDQHGVTLVVAAGNYNERPFRGWPPEALGESDRVAPPGDSVRALTVGSLAHLEKPNTRVRREQPSPFTRRGPGPAFIPKPEVVHYGGNCDAGASFEQTGVMSTTGRGVRAENIGTSFAAPMVATLLANVESALLTPASRNLTKALLIHSAVFESRPADAHRLRYGGFGVPGNLASVLTCTPWAATLIFETSLTPGLEFERWPFPIPDCLRNSERRVRGEILMTMAYDPPLDLDYGAEYCRANVEVSLGTYDADDEGTRQHKIQVPLEPKDVNKLYERELIENGFKWSPVKVYRRNIPRGIEGEDWRLKVTVHHRSGFQSEKAQDFALVVTLRDPDQKVPVYDMVVARMLALGWATQDLQVQDRVRSRI